MKYDLNPPIVIGETTYDSLTFKAPEVGVVGAYETAVAEAKGDYVLDMAAKAKSRGLDVPPFDELLKLATSKSLGDLGEFDAGLNLLAGVTSVPIEVIRKLSSVQMAEAQRIMAPLLPKDDEEDGGDGGDTPA